MRISFNLDTCTHFWKECFRSVTSGCISLYCFRFQPCSVRLTRVQLRPLVAKKPTPPKPARRARQVAKKSTTLKPAGRAGAERRNKKSWSPTFKPATQREIDTFLSPRRKPVSPHMTTTPSLKDKGATAMEPKAKTPSRDASSGHRPAPDMMKTPSKKDKGATAMEPRAKTPTLDASSGPRPAQETAATPSQKEDGTNAMEPKSGTSIIKTYSKATPRLSARRLLIASPDQTRRTFRLESALSPGTSSKRDGKPATD